MIELSHVTKQFGRTRAVADVSFTVQRGETIGLLGPNGSGKTTIMRILTGFFPPTTGCARVDGIDVAQHSLALRHTIGYLPEHVVLYPDMRVRGFLEFCASVRRMVGQRRRARVDAVLHDCGLLDVTDRLIGTLSKGYRQRVGLAQALLHEPQVLILDEPTVGLDPRQIIDIRGLIGRLRGHTTVLLSTHILPEVTLACDRVVIINRGHIVAQDSATALARQMEGADRTVVRVAGPATAVHGVLAAVPGVDHVDMAMPIPAADATAVCECVVHSRGGEAIRAAVAAAVVGQGWSLLELRPLALTLEELFVRLVANADVARA